MVHLLDCSYPLLSSPLRQYIIINWHRSVAPSNRHGWLLHCANAFYDAEITIYSKSAKDALNMLIQAHSLKIRNSVNKHVVAVNTLIDTESLYRKRYSLKIVRDIMGHFLFV
jgi:hypothetical protein